MQSVTVSKARELSEIYVKAGLVPMIKGSPGLGKSAIVKQMAEDFNLKLIDIRLAQCDPTDLLGFPYIDKELDKARYVPMDTFPLEGDEIPEGYSGWLVFMDELNAADRGVQKASYKPLLDKMIGTHNIHEKVIMMAAGNNDTDGALVEELSSALQSRLVHIHVVSHAPSWCDYATNANYAHQVISFIDWLPQRLNTFDPEKQGEEPTYACERTWEFVSKLLLKGLDPRSDLALPLLAGVIGEGAAVEFLGYLKMFKDLPTIEEIIAAPNSAKIPDGAGPRYAISGTIGHKATRGNVDQLLEYVERLPKEYQVVCLRSLGAKDASMIQTPAVKMWIAKTNTQLQAA